MGENNRPHVVIIGGGFGGLKAAQSLAHAPVRVTLVEKRNYQLFQPLLYQVATAELEPSDIAYPLRDILRYQKNIEFRMTRVSKIDADNKKVMTIDGKDITYDYLIIAAGGSSNFFGMQSIEENAFGLKDMEDAIGLRNHILSMVERAEYEEDPEVRKALLTFVVVGGGPTGVETAGAISELMSMVLVKDFPRLNLKEVKVILLEAATCLLPVMPQHHRDYTVEVLRKKKVDVRLEAKVVDFNGERVLLAGDEVIPSHTLVWGAGVQAASVARDSGLKLASMRRIAVTSTLQVESHPEVYAIGDSSHFEQDGRPLPMIAPVATQGAAVVAKNICHAIKGEDQETFVYKDPGAMAIIGRNVAVARMGNWEPTGFVAWLLWLVVHVIRLVGARNRIITVINWAWEYFFYDRSVRLIMPNVNKQIKE
ncbi:NAD(P)/FAD-dependent oxidoreductase [Propionispora vibrioides]|jgi:NADH dehydrogenase|uniref:NADH:ubiquinone reductase (non-electrogenic) n=1 Tax=Propionispora vibrioides TaxID=112903 RepID=A0A1H8VPS2_9FIRM|nr:NAD(P)/FAD-dependent oxidoreductase [Propionispora vibrioides]SEP16918.1 NADH dehydrogenase [Propionispora vibrioides]